MRKSPACFPRKLFDAVFRPRYYAGAKAEDIFEQQAHAEDWPVERISQDKEGWKTYRRIAGGPVKRGDFRISKKGLGAEIEVKCKTKYEDPRGDYYYLFKYSEIMGHRRMKDEVIEMPVVFAFYERKGRSVLVDTLRMVDLDFLLESSDYKRGKLYDEKTECIKIPFRYTREGFEVLDILSKRKRNCQTRRA